MAKYTLSRILLLIPTLLGMSLLIFLMLRLLPGDIVDILVGSDPTVSSSAREQLREAMGLTAPLPIAPPAVPDDLAAGDLVADPDGVAAGVVQDGGQAMPGDVPVIDDHPVSVGGAPVARNHRAIGRRTQRRTAGGREIDPVVQPPVAVDRVVAVAER